jgi:hypothetical protein
VWGRAEEGRGVLEKVWQTNMFGNELEGKKGLRIIVLYGTVL